MRFHKSIFILLILTLIDYANLICSGGQYSNNIWQPTPTCITCPANNQCPTSANDLAIACGQGTYSATGATSCLPCPAGSYCLGSSITCPTSEYQPAGGLGYCLKVPYGRVKSGSSTVACGTTQYGSAGVCTASAGRQYADNTASQMVRDCPDGYYINPARVTCTICPADKYCVGTTASPACTGNTIAPIGSKACISIPTNYAGNSMTNLRQCDAGQQVSSGNCVSCAAGKKCDNPLSTPIDCPAGEYSTGGSSFCKPCDSGSICSSVSATPVATGRYTADYTRLQLKCPAGTYGSSGSSLCTDCGIGSVCTAGACSACTACAAGTYALTIPKHSSVCKTPSSGFYVSGTTRDYASIEYCPTGKVVLTLAAPTACGDCPAGSYCPTSGTQLPCPAGFYCPGTSQWPILCDIKRTCPGTGASASTMCGAERFSMYGGIVAGCDPINLQAGYYQTQRTQYLKAVTPGNYYDGTETENTCDLHSFCIYGEQKGCPASNQGYTSPTGRPYCEQCPYGSGCFDVSSVLTCGKPARGPVISADTRFSKWGTNNCFNCNPDKSCEYRNQYFPYTDKTTDEIDCAIGTFSRRYELTCRDILYISNICPFGYSQSYKVKTVNTFPGEEQTQCTIYGLYNSNPIATGTQDCVTGAYTTTGFPRCLVSPPGYIMPRKNKDLFVTGNMCIDKYYCSLDFDHISSTYALKTARCPHSSYANTIIGSHTMEENCEVCPPGFLCPGNSKQEVCAPGYICELGVVAEKVTCPSGFYYDTAKTGIIGIYERCTQCVAGKVCATDNGPSLSTDVNTATGDCPEGHTCGIQTSNPYSYPADPGTYIPTTGNSGTTTGTTCPLNFYCPSGTKDPIPCPDGTMTITTGMHSIENCETCPPGKTCATVITGTTATVTPVDCPANHYCPKGSKDPRICPPGTYTSDGGKTTEDSCTGCVAGVSCYNDPTPGVTPAPAPVACEAGYYCLPRTYFPHETPCPDNTHSSASAESLSDCLACSTAGKYCLEGSSGEITCDKGYKCPGTGVKIACPAGSYSASGATTCTTCEAGNICPGGYHEVNKIPCPIGTFMTATGSAGPCTECTEGFMCPSPGMSAPTACGSGEWTVKGQIVCGNCPAGYSCNGGVKTKCVGGQHCPVHTGTPAACRAGYYCPVDLPVELLCPPGKISSVGAAVCTDTPPGLYSEQGASTGTTCEEGFYCELGSRSGKSKFCPPGTYSNTGADELSKCLQCTEGNYCPGGTQASAMLTCPEGHYCPTGSIIPTKCAAGTYKDDTGGISQNDCKLCEFGKVCSQRGLITDDFTCDPGYYCTSGISISQPLSGDGGYCKIGHYCERGSGLSVPCPAGKFNVFEGAKSSNDCLLCPFGFTCDLSDGTITDCPAGNYCPGGTTSTTLGHPNPGYHAVKGQGEPIKCSPGNFTDVTDKAECDLCTAGYTCPTPATGSVGNPLIKCVPGSYCEKGSVTSKVCPEGTYRDTDSAKSLSECLPCTAKKSCSTTGLIVAGADCEPGYFCKEGSFSETPGYTKLSPSDGTTPIFGPCPAGSYCGLATDDPVACDIGTFSAGVMMTVSTDCNKCLPGRYCDTAGITTYSGDCAAGYYCPSGTKSATENQCPVGNYCPAESPLPRPCSAGEYQDLPGQSVCKDCDAGNFCVLGSDNAGTICPQGFYCPAKTGYPKNNPCPPGTYGDSAGLDELDDCKACDDGYYCQGYGKSSYDGQCDAGYYCKAGAKATSPRPTAATEGGQCTAGEFCLAGSMLPTPCTAKYVCNEEAFGVAPTVLCNDGFKCGEGLAYKNPEGLELSGSGLCEPGNWCKGGDMTACVAGTYLPSKGAGATKANGADECLVCPYGHYCDSVGLGTPTGTCDDGYYCESGQTTKTDNPCQQGFKCYNAAIQQEPCEEGKYQDLTTQKDCKSCTAGTYCKYSSTAGTIGETQCEAGMYCPNADMDGAIPCSPKTFQASTGKTICDACTEGNYCDRYGLTAESTCPAGYFCDEGQESARLHICTPGYYCPPGSSVPTICSAGHYCADYGLGAESGACEAGYVCLQGSEVPNPTSVTGKLCSAGGYCPNGLDEIKCPIGTYNEYEGSTSAADCKLCLEGKICNVVGLTYPVDPADNCPAGKYCETILSPGPTLVQNDCTKGFKCPAGISEQILCLPGTYQDAVGQSDCKSCPEESYCDFDTTLTPIITVMKDCPSGYYCPAGTGDYKSYPCPEGTYNPGTKLKAESECTPCLETSYCIERGLSAVSGICNDGYTCPAGSKVPLAADRMCAKNKYCIAGVETDCPIDKYTYGLVKGATSSSNCMSCLPGKMCPNHDTAIEDCPAGFYCKDGVKTSCTIGNYCPLGIGEPLACSIGKYSPDPEASECTLCTDGFYCPSIRMSTQTTCSTDLVCQTIPTIGSVRPIPCGYGMRKDTDSTCVSCDAGKWCWPTNGNNIRGNCKEGYVCSSGANSPTPYNTVVKTSDDIPLGLIGYNGRAPRGCYTDTTSGASTAVKCAPGTYMLSMGAISCATCPPGYYCDTAGIYDLISKTCTAGFVCEAGSTVANPISGTGHSCNAHHYCPSGTAFDIPCADGFMANTGASECTRCDVGYSCTMADPHLLCYTGNTECKEGTGKQPLCPMGTYLSGSACVSCPAGLFCVDGRSEASPTGCGSTADHGQCCTAGYFCTGGASNSKPQSVSGHICTIGKYCPEGATAEEDCPADKYIFDTGKQQVSDCVACMEGFVCTTGSSTYAPCPAGNYCPTETTGATPCPKGTYSLDTQLKIVHGCKSCIEGFLCNDEGITNYNVDAYKCPAGKYCFEREITGIACPYGTYNDAKGGRNIKSCKYCPEGYTCPDLGQIDGYLYPCAGGQMCNTGSTYPSICPGGFYCNIADNKPKVICPVNNYCPPGSSAPTPCTLGETCPEGSAYPIKCVPGQISVMTDGVLQCQRCPPGTYSDSGLNGVCEICEAGYVCLGETNVRYPWNKDIHKGFKCPRGAYCPIGSSAPMYCPAGTYNSIIGSYASTACLLCKTNTFNPFEGQASCLACGDSADSEEGAAICQCKGKNRAFLISDSSCRCKPGYQFLENGIIQTDTNSKVDCQPIIYPRCSQKQSRSYEGKCTSSDDCTLACKGGKGVRSPTLGICQCENVQKLEHVCNKACRDEMPRMTVEEGRIRINKANDPYNKNPAYVIPKDLVNFNTDYLRCVTGKECSAKTVHFTTSGTIGSSYGLSPRLAIAYDDALNGRRRLDDKPSQIGRRLQQVVSSEEISNPVICIHQGDSVIFEIDGNGHYPVYQKDSLLNSNQNFDYAPFKILAEQISAQIANGETIKQQYFAYTFSDYGRYFFSDSIDTDQTTIIYVTKESEKCSSESAYLLPRTTRALSVFGLALNDTIMLEPDYILMAIILVSFVFTLAMLLILMKWVTDHIWKPKDVTSPLFREVQKGFDVGSAALTGTNNAFVCLPQDAVGASNLGIFKDVERQDLDNQFVPDLIEGINVQKLEELDPFIIEKILGDYQNYKDYLQQELLKGCEQQSKEIEDLNSSIEKVKFLLNERYEKLIGLLKLDVDYTRLTNVKIKAEEEKDEVKKADKRVKPSDIKLVKSEEKKAAEMLKQIMSKKAELNISGDAYEDDTDKDSGKSVKASQAKPADQKGVEDLTEKAKKVFESKLAMMEGLSDFEKEKLRDELSSELLDLEYMLVGEREQQEIAIRRLLQGRRKKPAKKSPAPVDLSKLSPEEKALKDKIEQEIGEEGKAQITNIEQNALNKIQRAKDKLLNQLGAPANLSENEKNMILHNHQEELDQFFENIKQEKDKQLEALNAKLEKKRQEKVAEKIRELREELNPELPADNIMDEQIKMPQGISENTEIGRLEAEEKQKLTELKNAQEQEKRRLENAHVEAFKDKEIELEEDLQLEIEKEMEVKKEKTEEKYRMKRQSLEDQRRKLKDKMLFSSGDKEATQQLMADVKVKDDQLRQLVEQERKEQDFLLEEKITRRRLAKEKKMLNFKNRQHDQAVDLKLGQLKKKQELQGKYELEKIKEIIKKAKENSDPSKADDYKLFEQIWNEKEGVELANMFGRQLAEKESKLRGIYKKNMEQKLLQKKVVKDKYKSLYNDLELQKIGGNPEDYAARHKELRVEEENDLKEMDIKEAMNQKKDEFALRQELEEKAAYELGELQDKLAREKIEIMRELFSGQKQEEVELRNKIAEMKESIEREKDRKIKDIELNKKLVLEKYENEMKQRFSSYEDIIKRQRETERLIKEKKGSIAKMVEERKKQIAELKDKAHFTSEQEKELIEKHQKELKELETAMEAERNRQFLIMKEKLEQKQGQREREQSYNKKKVAFLMGAVGKSVVLAQNEREKIPAISEPKTQLERDIERWRKDMEEREKSQKTTTFQTLQKYLENVGKFRKKGLEGIYLQGMQYQKYLKLMKASKILHKKLEELHRIKANGVLLDLKAALQVFAEDDFDRLKAKPERIGGGFRCFDEEGNILWELYKFIHNQ